MTDRGTREPPLYSGGFCLSNALRCGQVVLGIEMASLIRNLERRFAGFDRHHSQALPNSISGILMDTVVVQ